MAVSLLTYWPLMADAGNADFGRFVVVMAKLSRKRGITMITWQG